MTVRSRPSLLIFRLGSIGDTVVALPCFHAIATAFPHHHRVLLTNALTSVRASSAESVLDGTGLTDQTIYYPVGPFSIARIVTLIRDIRRIRPALVVYLAERASLAPVLRDYAFFKAAGVSRIIGAPLRSAARECRIDPETRLLEFEAERLARSLGGTVPVSLDPDDWDLHLTTEELAAGDGVLDGIPGGARGEIDTPIAIAPGAKVAAKDWGAERWDALLKEVTGPLRGRPLVIIGSADERAQADALARSWSGPVLNTCGSLTPRQTAALLRRCALLVCHDSGPMHLAASQRTPCVALFGNYNRPRKWFPFGHGHRVIHEVRGMSAITVTAVAHEVMAALRTPAAANHVNA